MLDRRLLALHAAAAGALAAVHLAWLEPVAGAPTLLPLLLGLAVLVALASPPAALGGAPAWVAAAWVSSAEPAGLAAAGAVVAAMALLSLGARRAPVASVAVVLGLSTLVPLARFAMIALHGFDRPWLRYLSPVELPALALDLRSGDDGPRPGPHENPPEVEVKSLTAGLFRPGFPVAVTANRGYYLGGNAGAWYHGGPGVFFPVLHDRPPVGGAIDWQPVQPNERLRFQRRGSTPERRRMADGWTLTGKEPPKALAVLEAFDDVQGAPAALRVLWAHRAATGHVGDPAVAPDRYDALEPPRWPDATRRRLALGAICGALTALLGALGRRPAWAVVTVLLGIAFPVVAARPYPLAVVRERAIVRLLPDVKDVAVATWIDAGAPSRAARLRLAWADDQGGLTPVVPSLPEPLRYEVAPREIRALPLPAGDRRLFRHLLAEVLPGPLERGAGEAFVNRTGVGFAEGWLVKGGRARPTGAVEDGATFAPAAAGISLSRLREDLDARGREGRELRRLLEVELRGEPEGGWLVLVAREPAASILGGKVEVVVERLPAIYIVAL